MTSARIRRHFISWFFIVNALIFLIIGSFYLKLMLQSTTLFGNLVFNYASIFGKIFVVIVLFATFFSYMLMLAFIPAAIVFLLSLIIPNTRFIITFSISLFSLAEHY